MEALEFLKIRQHQQGLLEPEFASAKALLKHFGAIQGQDDLGSRWAMGLRLVEGTESAVEEALSEGAILKTWLMRGTLAFLPSEDVKWMLNVLAPRTLSSRVNRRKALSLDESQLLKCRDAFCEALKGGTVLTRDEMYQVIGTTGMPVGGPHGYHLLSHWALEGLICFGPKKEKQDTFVLLQDWAPDQKHLNEDEALIELAKRYFVSRGPATLQDFMWWSGLKVADAKKGLTGAMHHLDKVEIDKKAYWFSKDVPSTEMRPKEILLLPGFDEYVLGYKDRGDFLDAEHAQDICPGNNGMFMPTVVSQGRIVGTWKRTLSKSKVVVTVEAFGELSVTETEGVEEQAEKYGRYLGCPAEIKYVNRAFSKA